MNCEVNKCCRESKFLIHRIRGNNWIQVCSWHDSFFGVENLIELGESKEDARRINQEVKHGI